MVIVLSESEVQCIHMNGRIYDPKLGRFLQADPFVQEPFNTQSLNRYSYVINNPLAYTDPSGFEFFKELFDDALGLTESPLLSSVVQIAGCAISGGTGCAYFVAGFNAANTYAATGDFGASLKAGAIAGFSAAAFRFIGGQFTDGGSGFWAQNGYGHIGSHAITGGVVAELQGGKFGHGFMSAGLTKALSPSFSDISGVTIDNIDIGEVVMAATLGGSISSLTGGKFANGAVTAAFANILNAQSRKRKQLNDKDYKALSKVAVSYARYLNSLEGSELAKALNVSPKLSHLELQIYRTDALERLRPWVIVRGKSLARDFIRSQYGAEGILLKGLSTIPGKVALFSGLYSATSDAAGFYSGAKNNSYGFKYGIDGLSLLTPTGVYDDPL